MAEKFTVGIQCQSMYRFRKCWLRVTYGRHVCNCCHLNSISCRISWCVCDLSSSHVSHPKFRYSATTNQKLNAYFARRLHSFATPQKITLWERSNEGRSCASVSNGSCPLWLPHFSCSSRAELTHNTTESWCSLGANRIENTESRAVTVLFPSNGRFFWLHNSCFALIYHNIIQIHARTLTPVLLITLHGSMSENSPAVITWALPVKYCSTLMYVVNDVRVLKGDMSRRFQEEG